MRDEMNSTMRPGRKRNGGGTRPWVVLPGVLLVAGLILFSLGCAPVANVSCSSNADVDAFLDKVNITDPEFRFVYPGHTELIASNGFWFSAGDITSQTGANAAPKPIIYGFNGVSEDFRRRDAPDSCSFTSQNDGCYRCDFCVDGAAVCNNGTILQSASGSFRIVNLAEVDNDTSAERVLSELPNPGDACFMRPNNPGNLSVLPEKNAVLKLQKNDLCGSEAEELAKFETTVVNTPRVYLATPDVYVDEADPSTQRFSYTMRLEGGKLDQNFSPDLRVTEVRVLAGVFNSATMKEEPVETRDALKRMLPSRILFLPSFNPGNINENIDEGTNRCYVDASVDDGNFDLFRNCRKDPNLPAHVAHEATPTYMNSMGRRALTLTWVIEYKVSDGLPGPPDFSMGERPILEFKLEEVQ